MVAVLGPNSSGKTTVLHAIRLACELLRVALDAEQTAKIRDQEIVVANGLLISDASRLTSLLD